MSDEIVVLEFWKEAYDGPGWYYFDEEYPEEGSVGAFQSESEAIAHATDAGYTIKR